MTSRKDAHYCNSLSLETTWHQLLVNCPIKMKTVSWGGVRNWRSLAILKFQKKVHISYIDKVLHIMMNILEKTFHGEEDSTEEGVII
jgi:hypothetical protein